jgi:uncharacterized circularly permuted ATP-grasp superfamily protein/uncharacterized alpha-E superfamily protein
MAVLEAPSAGAQLAAYAKGCASGDLRGDLYGDAAPGVAAKWRQVADGLAALSGEGGASFHEQLARQIQDMGLTFRLAGDEEERAWPLTPMPLIIGAEEWGGIERGLIQRARLMEALAADVYGPQRLIRDGHLPAAVVAGSKYFARKMVGLKPQGGHYLHVHAVDLARGPRGQWRVLGDRLRLATGIGYALENRLALSRATGTLLGDVNARRLAAFFAELRDGIARDCARERPRIALLTPGRFNQSYPEQAHLARYLGFPLVEGRDLIVSDNRLYVRTIAGPKRIDGIWRWIDTNAIDPLSFDVRSAIGVPDLFDAWARGGLEMANWPGVEVLETRAFAAFLPRLCRELLGEDALLPTQATWWCGQTREADEVRARFDDLLIAPAFDEPVEGLAGEPLAGRDIIGAAREALLAAIARRPMDYCAQEILELSTTPTLLDPETGATGFAPRPFTLRAFVARNAHGEWTVMPGGFARVSLSGRPLTALVGSDDLSADVCVVDEGFAPPPRVTTIIGDAPAVRRGGGILASQAADNLFWFGRYSERAETIVRVIRSLLGSSIEVDGAAGRDADVRRHLVRLLLGWGAISEKGAQASLVEICGSALAESELPGGVATLIRHSQRVGLALRDRLARDFSRISKRPPPHFDPENGESVLNAAKGLIEHFSALSGLIAENMVRGPAWRFLEMGRRLERALATARIVRALGDCADPAEGYGTLLDLCDSQIVYRSRYLTGPMRDPVYDLVLLDPGNPRALVFQVESITADLAALPSLNDEDGMPEPSLLAARALLAPLRSLTVADLTVEALGAVEKGLLDLSNLLTVRYFLPIEKSETRLQGGLLA